MMTLSDLDQLAEAAIDSKLGHFSGDIVIDVEFYEAVRSVIHALAGSYSAGMSMTIEGKVES